MAIDLHAHTTASDGTFSPRELVAHAKELGLSAVAVSDHDTFFGWRDALEAGEELGVQVVPAIELSVADEHGKFHLLGFFPFRTDLNETELGAQISELQRERDERNTRIYENLKRLGVPVEAQRVREIAGGGAQIGRPHIATAMIERGYATSVQDAFNKYLDNNGPAYSAKKALTPAQAVKLIHDAGGVAVWAHPTRSPSERAEVLDFSRGEALLQLWRDWGLDGLETFYGAYSPEEAAWTRAMSEKYDLLGTGGSDFHGATKPGVPLGRVNGGGEVPDEVLSALRLRAKGEQGKPVPNLQTGRTQGK